jgi:hypothetical protein
VADTIRNMKRIDLDASKPKPKGKMVKKNEVEIFIVDDIQKLEYTKLRKEWTDVRTRYEAGLEQACSRIWPMYCMSEDQAGEEIQLGERTKLP